MRERAARGVAWAGVCERESLPEYQHDEQGVCMCVCVLLGIEVECEWSVLFRCEGCTSK
jgi:hypothetical protein